MKCIGLFITKSMCSVHRQRHWKNENIKGFIFRMILIQKKLLLLKNYPVLSWENHLNHNIQPNNPVWFKTIFNVIIPLL